jgi:hypothetical protein
MKKEFVIRGQTGSGLTETLNFSGFKPGMAYRLTEFQLYPSQNIGSQFAELVGTITAGKTAIAPTDVDFNNDGLIASLVLHIGHDSETRGNAFVPLVVLNDTFLITQNLILMVQNTSGSGDPINWQCRFEAVKMTGSEEAVTNYKQFAISDS